MSDLYAWTPTSGYPTTTPTALKSIATSKLPLLTRRLGIVTASLETAEKAGKIKTLSQIARGIDASISIVKAEMVLATATDSDTQASATEAIVEAMYNLELLADDRNHFHYYLLRFGNIFFFILFVGMLLFLVLMLLRSRYHWYNVTFILGFGFQAGGFGLRILAFSDNTKMMYYAGQSFLLTLSPAFIMAGIYFLFAQCVIVHGKQYSVLKPMWYSYFFIGCDIVSLLVQGAGGALAQSATDTGKSASLAMWVMFAGIMIQTLAMTIFLYFWFEFNHRLYFKDRDSVPGYSEYKQCTFKTYMKALFAAPSARYYKKTQLEPFYNPRYSHLRLGSLLEHFKWAVSIAVILIYIRCVFRTVELKQGFEGYLATHEIYLLVLDSLMIAAAGFLLLPFHPVFMFGRENILKLANVKGESAAGISGVPPAASYVPEKPTYPDFLEKTSNRLVL